MNMIGAETIPAVTTQRNLHDPEFWRNLNPALHLYDAEFCAKATAFNIEATTAKKFDTRMMHEGYFQFHVGPENWPISLPDMAAAVKTLVEAELAPPFAFLYDEFWLLFFMQSRVLASILGEDYRMLPDFWAWYVDPAQGGAGWSPHRDKDWKSLFEDGRPKSLSVWIPLTVASPTNGCMYVVPSNRDRNYGTEKDKEWVFDQADVRALPGKPGDVFIWNQALLHWGSRTSPFSQDGARISASVEFQRNDVDPFNLPLMSPNQIPSFEMRLKLIGKQILQYKHMYPLFPDLEAFAQAVLAD